MSRTTIRRMTAADLGLGMRVKAQAGWNQTEADWQRLLALEPDGCFVAEWDGRPAGTTTVCVFQSVGWIAMVLVDEALRHRGIATALVRHALEYLAQRGAATVRLDATPMGRPVYEKLGFAAEYDLVRLEGAAQAGPAAHPSVRPAGSDEFDAIAALDRQVTATDRRRLLECLGKEPRVFVDGSRVLGYAMFREGAWAAQVGPAVAMSEEAGGAVCDAAMAACAGRQVYVDVPTDNAAAMAWAALRELRVQRPFTRMCRGRPIADQPAHMWASSGPECG